MPRLTRVLAGALVAGTALLWCDVPAASAAAPAAAGWWTSLNPGSTLGSPTPPPPPDVPSDGLLVEGGADSTPTAFAALVYELSPGMAAGKLTLTVAANSATTPASSLQLCALSNPTIIVEHGGPMADAPTYNCSAKLTTAPSADGSRYEVDVARLVVDGVLAVAVLPTSQTDRVVLAAPDASSLTTTASAVPKSTDTETAAPDADLGTAPPPLGPDVPPAVGVVAPSGSAAASAPAPTPLAPQIAAPAVTSAPPFRASSFTPPSHRTRPVALVLVIAGLLAAGARWEGAGRAAARAALNA
jgi:hypothetical protein